MKHKMLFLIIIILFLSGCSNNKNELNVLNWSSYIPEEVLTDFSREYNIKLNYSTYSSNEELLAKVSGTKLGTYDIIFPSDYMITIMKSKNYLSPLDKSKLTNYNNISPIYLDLEYDMGNIYSLPFLVATEVIAYNKEKISESIKGYNDLLNPKYKKDIVLIDDERTIIGNSLQSLGYDMNDTNKDHLENASLWLEKLKNNVKIFDSDSPKSFLISGECNIGVLWNAEANLAQKENKNIEIIYPEEGYLISIDNYTIMNNAKNIDNAYLFIDYLLRGDVMAKIINNYPYGNVNTEAYNYLTKDYEKTNITQDIINKGTFIKNIGEHITDYDKIWVKIK